jgi:hypothetical protein
MAYSLATLVADVGTIYVTETDTEDTSKLVKAGSGTLYKVEIVNPNGAAVYAKFYDSTSSITSGTTHPDWVFMCPASVTRSYACPGGTAFGTGLKFECVTTPGTGGSTAPTAAVTVRVLAS